MRIGHIGILAAAISCGILAGRASAGLLFSDNFNAPDGGLDSASTAGRLGGTLAGSVAFQSQQVVQNLVGGQLQLLNVGYSGTTSVRFNHDYDWASGSTGSDIATAGGMDISFDWTAPENTSGNWISYSVGIDPGARDNAYEVVGGSTDGGILLRDNGGVSTFKNGGSSGTNSPFNAAVLLHHVDLAYSFSSWADGSPVGLIATVDGTVVAVQSFAWSGNGGVQYMELASANSGSAMPLIDNFAVSIPAVPEPASLGFGVASLGLLARRRRSI